MDHITYVAPSENERVFVDDWAALDFRTHVVVKTVRYPASHIALTAGSLPTRPWALMTGLSVSPDPASPVNEFVRRYGPGQQHVAYSVEPDVDMDVVFNELQQTGMHFMTGVLTYREGTGARLRQIFTAPTRPYGTFVEFIQRLPGQDGEPFGGFDPENIDDLYQAYDDYSRWLDRQPGASTARS